MNSRWISGGAILAELGILPQELVDFVKQGLVAYRANGFQIRLLHGEHGTVSYRYSEDKGRWWEEPKFRDRVNICQFHVDEVCAFISAHYPSLLPQDVGSPSGDGVIVTAETIPIGTSNGSVHKKQKRYPITQKAVSIMCGVSTRQIQKWEKGEQTPARYPGREDLAIVKAWAETYQQRKFLSKKARAMNHAAPMDPQLIAATRDEDSGNVFD